MCAGFRVTTNFSGTWLDNSISDVELHVDSYNLVRRDCKGHGGGVLYVCDFLSITSIVRSERSELVWVRVPWASGQRRTSLLFTNLEILLKQSITDQSLYYL